MTANATSLATLIERAKEYGTTTLELFKLNTVDKSADVVSSLVSRLAVLMTVALSVIIINIGFALWIGKQLGETFYGFFIIGAFYAVLAIILSIFRHQWIKYPISNSIIKQLLKQKRYEN